ncbi:GGDEF domain-containing protein [Pseudooctadecabacter sp.]|uniref:GGDEF domain-containing protein n=1 Tax=Pseudooctadecabacter sp. TaxID=1966338 RepID=UPI0025E9221B|nr:GGDEF domain-containing protein [Pseudooctadecabacter sp.]
MRISTRAGIWIFALVISACAVGLAVALNVVVFPEAILPVTMRGTVAITSLVAMPICLFVGSKIYENQKLSDELQRLVNRDRLTDAATRDFFFAQMERDNRAYGVSLMVDIDHFKIVNDTYGHLIGDEVIRHVSDILRRNVRSGDIVARFGGEEFVIFLDGHDKDIGFLTAERMRRDIAQHGGLFGGHPVNVTVSIGGSLKEAFDSVDASIRDADAALYRAKSQGRNQTVFAQEMVPLQDTG